MKCNQFEEELYKNKTDWNQKYKYINYKDFETNKDRIEKDKNFYYVMPIVYNGASDKF